MAVRLSDKIQQTCGGPPAWLRIDDIGIALADAPHVLGVIITGADPASISAVAETVWPRTDHPAMPSRERLARGPVAMHRALPGRRQRMTFVLPNRNPHVLLPAGTGLEPGLWYDGEPGWLNNALHVLGHPPLGALLLT